MDFNRSSAPGASVTPAGAGAPGGTPLVIEGSTARFQEQVLDASARVPVLVDFWAPWCGPCRQLGPALEKVVGELGGRMRLVKINVDENQALAGQMGVQSIPAVFAFVGGRPVDGFMGALPESELRRFAQKVLDASKNLSGPEEEGAEIRQALEAAAAALAAGDLARAEQIYGLVLQHAPENDDALLGLASMLMKADDAERAEAALDMVSEEGRKRAEYLSLIAALQLAREAASLGSIPELEARLAAGPDDHQARFDLALALNARGFKLEAAEALIALMRRDRTWNDDAVRKKLVDLFEAWGPKDPATSKARRLLSAALFS